MKLSSRKGIYAGLCGIIAIGLLLVILEPSYHGRPIKMAVAAPPDTPCITTSASGWQLDTLPKGTYTVTIIRSVKSTWWPKGTYIGTGVPSDSLPLSARLVPFDNHRWAWIDRKNNWIPGSVLVEDSILKKRPLSTVPWQLRFAQEMGRKLGYFQQHGPRDSLLFYEGAYEDARMQFWEAFQRR